MKQFEIKGYFGYWGMMSTVVIEANTFREATENFREKVMELYKDYGRGSNQKKFHCKVLGYRVIQEIKPYIEFKNEIKF